MKEKGKIVITGMGGLLCPPGHPMLTQSVQTDLRRRPQNRGGMALDYAVKSPMLDEATREAARKALASWKKLPLDAPEIQDWIRKVLGYCRDCYNLDPDNESGWHIKNLTIDTDRDPIEYADCHAGVHMIRQYYPEYKPLRKHFREARWGD